MGFFPESAIGAPAEGGGILKGWNDAELFRALVEFAPDAIVAADEHGRIALVNQQAEKLFGYSRGELLGGQLEMLVPERYRAAHIEHRARYLTEAVPRPMGSGLDLVALRKDGTEFAAEISLSPIRGATMAVAVAVRDITERKRNEEKIRRAKRLAEEEQIRAQLAEEALQARQQFLAIASHELRSPLNALHMQVEVLRHLLADQSAALSEGVISKAEGVRKTVARLMSLVENLLDLSRIAQGKLDLSLGDVDLAEVVREVAGRYREIAQQAGSEISVSAPASLRGRWDRVRVDQVLTNLLSNAVKFAAGGPIKIGLHSLGEEAILVVRDYGEGLDPSELERNYQPFGRAAARARRKGGLGLGLFLVNQIVHAHGGRMEVQGRPGEGATFRVILPISQRADG